MYSIEVLKEVLKSHGYRLESLDKPSQVQVRENPQLAEGFLLNKSSHWFTIRQVHGTFWVLDSMRDKPESLSGKHIRGVIRQLGYQGYTCFVINGRQSLPKSKPSRTHAKCWFDVERLMYDEKQPGADKDRWLQFDDDDSDGRKRSRDDSNSTRTHGSGITKLMNMGMGWTRRQCEVALREAQGDANRAVNILLSSA